MSDSRSRSRSMISVAVLRRGNSPKYSSMYWISHAPGSSAYCLIMYSTDQAIIQAVRMSGSRAVRSLDEKGQASGQPALFGRGSSQAQGGAIALEGTVHFPGFAPQLGLNGR